MTNWQEDFICDEDNVRIMIVLNKHKLNFISGWYIVLSVSSYLVTSWCCEFEILINLEPASKFSLEILDEEGQM
jgi:hypothetical protein